MELTTLQEAAEAREEARARLEAAIAARDALEPAWKTAGKAVSAASDELKRIELAMHSVKRAHMIGQAVAAAGVQTDDPVLQVAPSDHRLPTVYELVAVSATGIGLYRFKPDKQRRYLLTEHAILLKHVPQAVLDARAAVDAVPTTGNTKAILEPLYERLEELTGPGSRYELRPITDAPQLMRWQARGKSDFGHDGPRKPVPPPDGGRWRWLKVNEQQELEDAS